MEQRLSVITLGVADLDRARRFYEEGLGWKASGEGSGEIVFFQTGASALALYPRAALAEEVNLPGGGDSPGGEAGPDGVAGFAGVTLAHNVRHREDVDSTLREAEAAGAAILKPAQDAFWGGYSGYFADPDGHPWEVVWNPHWEMDEEGGVILPS
jgi:catechol 2,3-dioxygenase-like lactoylglutathione lyase family enzyme